MIRAVFFDLDSTLIDADTAYDDAAAEAAKAFAARLPAITWERFLSAFNEINSDLFRRLRLEELTMAEVRDTRFSLTMARCDIRDDALAEELNQVFGEAALNRLRPFDDTGVIEALRERVHVGIITNGASDAHVDSQMTKIRVFEFENRVDSIWISDAVGARKPNPRIFHEAIRPLGISPDEAVHIGDRLEDDILGANRAGLTSVWVNRTGASSAQPGSNHDPDLTVTTLADIPRHLELPKTN